MQACAVHPTFEAFGACRTCKQPLCDSCLAFNMGRSCGPCEAAAKRKSRVALAVGGTVVAAGIILLAINGKKINDKRAAETSAKVAEATKLAAEPIDLRLAKQKWAKVPCDYEAALTVVEESMELGRNQEAIDAVDAWQPACGEPRKLLWRKYRAHLELGQPQEATTAATALIASRPADSDFWWWRGDAQWRYNLPGAFADFRQSMANSGEDSLSQYAAGIVARVAEQTADACELVFALNYFTRVQGGTLSDDADRAYQATMFGKKCDELAVGTSGKLTRPKGEAGVFGDFTVGERTISARVDEKAGTTAITTALASELGLAIGEAKIEGLVLGTMMSGRLAKVPAMKLGGLELSQVDVMVVDAIASDDEMVAGFNILWRLQPTVNASSITLVPWKL